MRNPDLASSTAYRLSFFTRKFTTQRGLASTTDKDFLGYVVVKEDAAPSFVRILRIYESVLRPPRHDNNFVRGSQDWRCQSAGSRSR